MSGQSHPHDDHWYSLVSELGLTPPEPERDAAPGAEQPVDAQAADDRTRGSASQPPCSPPCVAADDRTDSSPEGDSYSLFDGGPSTLAEVQEPTSKEAHSESMAMMAKSENDAAQRKPSFEPRPTTDWDLLAEELGIAPAKETENTSAAAPTSETAAGEDYVATPQRVHERIDVFERSGDSRTAAAEGGFGEGILDPSAAGSSTAHSDWDRSQRRPRKGISDSDATDSEPAASADEEPHLAAGDEDRPARDGKKRKRRRRKAKSSRSSSDARAAEADDKTIAANDSDSIDLPDAEPAWIDGDEDSDLVATAERSDEPAGRRSRPSRDSRGESRQTPSADERSRPARHRTQRDEDDTFDDEGEEDELRPAHKQIPTWEQAVGCIIQSNIEARSRRGDSSRGRGRSGGRR